MKLAVGSSLALCCPRCSRLTAFCFTTLSLLEPQCFSRRWEESWRQLLLLLLFSEESSRHLFLIGLDCSIVGSPTTVILVSTTFVSSLTAISLVVLQSPPRLFAVGLGCSMAETSPAVPVILASTTFVSSLAAISLVGLLWAGMLK